MSKTLMVFGAMLKTRSVKTLGNFLGSPTNGEDG